MSKIKYFLITLFRNEEGASALEYAIMAGTIAAALGGAVGGLTTDLGTAFANLIP